MLYIILFTLLAKADPDWTATAPIPVDGRVNIFNWSGEDFARKRTRGQVHAQVYPVEVTGALPPYAPFRKLADAGGSFGGLTGVRSFDDVLALLGLHPYPLDDERGVYQVPYPEGVRPNSRMGLGLIARSGGTGFTFSCAGCHSANLFGKTVLGMTNRFPRANAFFYHMKPAFELTDQTLFKLTTGASAAEMRLFESTRVSLARVGVKKPVTLGLDTSLAQVALSLNRRVDDGWATPSAELERRPRRDPILDERPADSKPAVWWNVKYKNRWLSDGSVLSGNPIFTNLIWNELGRGTDLRALADWLARNPAVIEELTTAVFASEAPRITDFFPASRIDLTSAKRGEVLFEANCAKCHGRYEKAWSLPGADRLSDVERLRTVHVRPVPKTFVANVGTDAYRREGMKSLETLNRLEISRLNAITVAAQNGYVPPPLVGIWARWPYLHNNSIPDLCSLLTRASERRVTYYSGEANDPERDFDFACNGYPATAPVAWRTREHLYDTRRAGMSNAGHEDGIILEGGREKFTAADKRALIAFLQTL